MVMRLQHWIALFLMLFFFVLLTRAYAQTAPSKFIANLDVNINAKFVTDQTVSSATFTSNTIVIGRTVGMAVQINFTDCNAICDGTVRLLGSIDGVNFVEIPDCSAEISDNGAVLFNFPQIYFPYMRVEYEERATNDTVINVFTSIKERLG